MMKDFRAGLKLEVPKFRLIIDHNKNVLKAKGNISGSISQGYTKRTATHIQTTINCGASKKVLVKTFNDGTSLVEAQHG